MEATVQSWTALAETTPPPSAGEAEEASRGIGRESEEQQEEDKGRSVVVFEAEAIVMGLRVRQFHHPNKSLHNPLTYSDYILTPNFFFSDAAIDIATPKKNKIQYI